MAYDVLDVKPMTRRIGAEIFGVDLGKPLSNRQFEEIHQALTQHQVIFFRDQEMSHEAHKDFGRKFGNLAIHSGVPGLPEHPEIVAKLEQIAEEARADLGDDIQKRTGANVREPGRVSQ